MDYKIFSSNRSILQSSAVHPINATADKSGHFVPVGVTSAFINTHCFWMDKIVLQIIINYFTQPFIHCVIPSSMQLGENNQLGFDSVD